MKHRVFISYRRESASELALLLYSRLKADGYQPFLDRDGMHSGDFNTQLYERIGECSHMIVLLPENALERTANEGDWMRQEIAHALKNNKTVIPLMARNFRWPQKLPEEIDGLRNKQGLEINMEYFDAFYAKLCQLIGDAPKNGRKKFWIIGTAGLLAAAVAFGAFVLRPQNQSAGGQLITFAQTWEATEKPEQTAKPTPAPTATPTAAPTAEPTQAPTATPTAEPTAEPTLAPTATPAPVPALRNLSLQQDAFNKRCIHIEWDGSSEREYRVIVTRCLSNEKTVQHKAMDQTVMGTYAAFDGALPLTAYRVTVIDTFSNNVVEKTISISKAAPFDRFEADCKGGNLIWVDRNGLAKGKSPRDMNNSTYPNPKEGGISLSEFAQKAQTHALYGRSEIVFGKSGGETAMKVLYVLRGPDGNDVWDEWETILNIGAGKYYEYVPLDELIRKMTGGTTLTKPGSYFFEVYFDDCRVSRKEFILTE